MASVDVMIHDGLLQIRDAITRFTKEVDAEADTDLLLAADVPWQPNWNRSRVAIGTAAQRTAHERFKQWYTSAFRGTKRPFGDTDPSGDYVDNATSGPSQDSLSPSRSTPPLTRSRSRAARRQLRGTSSINNATAFDREESGGP